MIIFSIETSCDETSTAILQADDHGFKILSHKVFSQIDTHTQFGGIVPEVAARLHVPKILPLIDETFKEAQLSSTDIDAIAVTGGPGLVTALIVGIHTARMLSYIWDKPLISVNHMEGHVMSGLLSHGKDEIEFPALCMTVSGGHTELVLIKSWGEYEIIGQTRDDAVGECFDKVAKMLGLPYPGGPQISRIAGLATEPVEFTPPMMHTDNFDFSFSGLKTSVLYYVRNLEKENNVLTEKQKANIAAGFENAAVKVLVHKTKRALQAYSIKSLFIGGGVAANKTLRSELTQLIEKHTSCTLYIPQMSYCTDNAAMIAMAGYFKAKNKDYISPSVIKADPTWTIGTEQEQ